MVQETPGINCSLSVAKVLENADMNNANSNFDELQQLESVKFRPILAAVLACEICLEQGGWNCPGQTSIDVVEEALRRNVFPAEIEEEYFDKMARATGLKG